MEGRTVPPSPPPALPRRPAAARASHPGSPAAPPLGRHLMAQARRTFREVFESGHSVLVIQLGPGPDGVGLVMWDGAHSFTVWLTFDGCGWERVGSYEYQPDDWRDAQEWAAHRLAQLLIQ